MSETTPPSKVTVVDFDMSFGKMVTFLVKLAIAAIPAAIILFVLGVLLVGVLGGLGGLGI
jgi:hypothetical protein